MRLTLHLQLPADARFLPTTRRALSSYLEDVVEQPDVVQDVVLALDEACANVIRHAFPGRQQATYEVRADIDPDMVEISVEDSGIGLDPRRLDVGMDDVDLEAMSGRGLSMIQGLMSEVTVEPGPDGGTRLCMRRHLDPVLS